METFFDNICKLKHEFVKSYKGNSHTTEILPNSPSNSFVVEKNHLVLLHKFLENNPIYSNQISERLCDVNCTIFEGDLNNYWIDSIKHDTSYAPFYPTWMLSAWGLVCEAQTLGFEQIIDIGCGGGHLLEHLAKAVGEHLASNFDLDVMFIDIDNPV